MILKIRSIGEPVLRSRAKALRPEEILLPSTRDLIAAMRETMQDAPGVGLAAPQVGVPLQLAVIEDREEYRKTSAGRRWLSGSESQWLSTSSSTRC